MNDTNFNPFSLAGKTLLITGASSGIGYQIAKSCALMGATIIASGRNEERLSALLEELPPAAAHRAIACDIMKRDNIEELAKQSGKINGLVHCAGISLLAPVRMLPKAHIDDIFSTNTIGPIYLTQQLLSRNAVLPGGAIVFISSIAAYIGVPGTAMYAASKAALIAVARCLSMEVAKKKIRVNCLAPSLVEGKMLEMSHNVTGGADYSHPLGFGQAEDVANATIFFLSDASRWITGTTLVLDGGLTVT